MVIIHVGSYNRIGLCLPIMTCTAKRLILALITVIIMLVPCRTCSFYIIFSDYSIETKISVKIGKEMRAYKNSQQASAGIVGSVCCHAAWGKVIDALVVQTKEVGRICVDD